MTLPDADLAARLTEIEERASKATSGPWQESGRDVDHDRFVTEGRNPGDVCGLGCEIDGPPEAWLRGQFARHDDAAFIAAARDDIPWLLAQLVEARERETALEQDARRLFDALLAVWDTRLIPSDTWDAVKARKAIAAHDELTRARTARVRPEGS